MKNPFKKAADRRSEAEQALKTWGIKYKKGRNGSIFVPGDLNIAGRGLTRLPDLSSVTVGGAFWCNQNQLTSLEGAPQCVSGDFFCYDNQLTSLEGAPQRARGNFWCYDNQLTSLKGGPHFVDGGFFCFNNKLASLEGAPHTDGGHFWCHNNQLTSLEHAPQNSKFLRSDLGVFKSWDEVPEKLRSSQETKAYPEAEKTGDRYRGGFNL